MNPKEVIFYGLAYSFSLESLKMCLIFCSHLLENQLRNTEHTMKSNLNNFANHKKYSKEIVIHVRSLPKNNNNIRMLLCTGQIEASTSPPGIPRTNDRFNLPGGGEFDPLA